MIKLFGDQNASDLEKQLLDLEESFKLKKIPLDEYEVKKVRCLKLLLKCWDLTSKSFSFGYRWTCWRSWAKADIVYRCQTKRSWRTSEVASIWRPWNKWTMMHERQLNGIFSPLNVNFTSAWVLRFFFCIYIALMSKFYVHSIECDIWKLFLKICASRCDLSEYIYIILVI